MRVKEFECAHLNAPLARMPSRESSVCALSYPVEAETKLHALPINRPSTAAARLLQIRRAHDGPRRQISHPVPVARPRDLAALRAQAHEPRLPLDVIGLEWKIAAPSAI